MLTAIRHAFFMTWKHGNVIPVSEYSCFAAISSDIFTTGRCLKLSHIQMQSSPSLLGCVTVSGKEIKCLTTCVYIIHARKIQEADSGMI